MDQDVSLIRHSADQPALVKALGGRRGIVDGGLPAVVFVAVNAFAGIVMGATIALQAAILASVVTGVAVVLLRLVRKQPLKQALRGLVALAVAVLLTAWSGEARDFFLPGIYVDGLYALVFAGSALVGFPLVGVIFAALYQLAPTWRTERRLRRVFAVATLGWSFVFTLRTIVQALFYERNWPELLAVSKLLLGWPLTIVALGLTLAAARRAGAHRHHRSSSDVPPHSRVTAQPVGAGTGATVPEPTAIRQRLDSVVADGERGSSERGWNSVTTGRSSCDGDLVSRTSDEIAAVRASNQRPGERRGRGAHP